MAAGSAAFAEVQLTIQNGRVSLIAKDATIRQILAEWARIGQTKVVNVERLTGPTLILPPPRGPVFSTFPVPQVVNPQQNGAPGAPYVQPQIVIPQADVPGQPPPAVSFPGGSQPSVPSGGTPRPGMVVPAPPQPG